MLVKELSSYFTLLNGIAPNLFCMLLFYTPFENKVFVSNPFTHEHAQGQTDIQIQNNNPYFKTKFKIIILKSMFGEGGGFDPTSNMSFKNI